MLNLIYPLLEIITALIALLVLKTENATKGGFKGSFTPYEVVQQVIPFKGLYNSLNTLAAGLVKRNKVAVFDMSNAFGIPAVMCSTMFKPFLRYPNSLDIVSIEDKEVTASLTRDIVGVSKGYVNSFKGSKVENANMGSLIIRGKKISKSSYARIITNFKELISGHLTDGSIQPIVILNRKYIADSHQKLYEKTVISLFPIGTIFVHLYPPLFVKTKEGIEMGLGMHKNNECLVKKGGSNLTFEEL